MKLTKEQQLMIFRIVKSTEELADEKFKKHKERTGKDLIPLPTFPIIGSESLLTEETQNERKGLREIKEWVDPELETVGDRIANSLIDEGLERRLNNFGYDSFSYLIGNVVERFGFNVQPEFKKYIIEGKWTGTPRFFRALLLENREKLKYIKDLKAFLVNIHIANNVKFNKRYLKYQFRAFHYLEEKTK